MAAAAAVGESSMGSAWEEKDDVSSGITRMRNALVTEWTCGGTGRPSAASERRRFPCSCARDDDDEDDDDDDDDAWTPSRDAVGSSTVGAALRVMGISNRMGDADDIRLVRTGWNGESDAC